MKFNDLLTHDPTHPPSRDDSREDFFKLTPPKDANNFFDAQILDQSGEQSTVEVGHDVLDARVILERIHRQV
ncbi:MAG: hypothetical protein NWQ68_07185, partial [Ilumatobacteraceae bacterium]|nr:hypothetical protein [Ilumatobacteraceae bacterium]